MGGVGYAGKFGHGASTGSHIRRIVKRISRLDRHMPAGQRCQVRRSPVRRVHNQDCFGHLLVSRAEVSLRSQRDDVEILDPQAELQEGAEINCRLVVAGDDDDHAASASCRRRIEPHQVAMPNRTGRAVLDVAGGEGSVAISWQGHAEGGNRVSGPVRLL